MYVTTGFIVFIGTVLSLSALYLILELITEKHHEKNLGEDNIALLENESN